MDTIRHAQRGGTGLKRLLPAGLIRPGDDEIKVRMLRRYFRKRLDQQIAAFFGMDAA